MTFALALLVAIASQTATVEASDGADSYLGFLDVQVIVEKHDGTQARGKLVALSPTTITVRLKDLRLLEVPRTEVSTVTAEAGPTAPPEPALAPVEVKSGVPEGPKPQHLALAFAFAFTGGATRWGTADFQPLGFKGRRHSICTAACCLASSWTTR